MLYYYRKQIVIVSLLLVALITSFVVYSYVTSFQYLTVSYVKKEGTATLYQKPDEKSSDLKKIQIIQPNEKMKVKKGTYVVKVSGDIIQSDQETIEVGDNPVSKKLVFRFSDAHLASLLQNEQPAITLAIASAYPTLNSLYTAARAKLYDRGQYYGQVFTYKGKDSDNRDSVRVVLEKKDGQWRAVSKSSSPLLSIVEFPTVPRYILQDIDQPSVLPGTANSPIIDEKNGLEYNY